MSGSINAPLFAAEQAIKLLDEVVYERVLSMFDLDQLYQFEQELWLALHECGLSDDAVPDAAKAMVDRALDRIGDDPRRYLTMGTEGLDEDCPLCADLIKEREKAAKPPRRGSS